MGIGPTTRSFYCQQAPSPFTRWENNDLWMLLAESKVCPTPFRLQSLLAFMFKKERTMQKLPFTTTQQIIVLDKKGEVVDKLKPRKIKVDSYLNGFYHGIIIKDNMPVYTKTPHNNWYYRTEIQERFYENLHDYL